jgi:hypothetical protein
LSGLFTFLGRSLSLALRQGKVKSQGKAGRSVFSAYNVYALDIQRKQTKRVPFFLCSKTRPQKFIFAF